MKYLIGALASHLVPSLGEPMKYLITADITVRVAALVTADSEEEAFKLASNPIHVNVETFNRVRWDKVNGDRVDPTQLQLRATIE